jgi:hypothetical protein
VAADAIEHQGSGHRCACTGTSGGGDLLQLLRFFGGEVHLNPSVTAMEQG